MEGVNVVSLVHTLFACVWYFAAARPGLKSDARLRNDEIGFQQDTSPAFAYRTIYGPRSYEIFKPNLLHHNLTLSIRYRREC